MKTTLGGVAAAKAAGPIPTASSQARAVATVHDYDLMAGLCQIIGSGDADDAAAEHDHAHESNLPNHYLAYRHKYHATASRRPSRVLLHV